MKHKSKRTGVFAKFVGGVLVILLLLGVIGFVYRYTNGFNEDFKTFYVVYDGEKILAENSVLTLDLGETHRFGVKYTFDSGKSEARGYSVSIVPNAEADFTFTADERKYSWAGDVVDITDAFDLNYGDDWFEITVGEDAGIEEILKRLYEGKEIVLSGEPEADNPYLYTLVVSSYNGSVTYYIDFALRVVITGIDCLQRGWCSDEEIISDGDSCFYGVVCNTFRVSVRCNI